ncbi:MAG: class I SAM-dependent methyltransferase [Chloroflexi bacterium]|nr:class I SAM-dependent methyltransferase [Chloroflexota bacterium]
MTLSASHFTDKQLLTTQSYKTPDKLSIRIQTHELYTQPKTDFTAWVLDRIRWRGDEIVVDVGCGAGAYIEATQQRSRHYISGDLSLGMLQGLNHSVLPRLNLDAQRLPLADNTVDVVLANHMLYHVPDRDAAVAEIARVLRPGGVLLAATNSGDTMAELKTLRWQGMARLGLEVDPTQQRSPVADLFSLENGRALLSPHFTHIERCDLPSALVFPNPQPILDYLDSSRDWFIKRFLSDSATADDLLQALRDILDEYFIHNDEFRVNKLSGVFVCR